MGIANWLAADIGVGLAFMPQGVADVTLGFECDYFDRAISGITATAQADRLGYFSEAYMFVNMAMVVPDYQQREFLSPQGIWEMDELPIGVLKRSYFRERAKSHLPQAEIVLLDSERDFFDKPVLKLDVLLSSAEGGCAWTLLSPHFTSVDTVAHVERAPLLFTIAADMDIEEFLEVWIRLKKLDGTLDSLVDYWIKGEEKANKPPTWSEIRDVLHWVE